jgi:hypothetical protein
MVHSKEATMEGTARLRVGILLILIVVALVSSLWAVWPWPTGDWKGLALNFGTEMAGAVVTYALLELFIGRRERREAEEEELAAKKADLIAQMGSSVKDVAVAAAEELRRHGWLTDGSLQGAFLARANLQGASLAEAKLEGANLQANLQGANLVRANLEGAVLMMANLEGARLIWANLEGAFLQEANLEGAFLPGANLQGAKFNDETTLPDGTKWTPDTDMTRFTDPDHPDFWWPDA